VNLSSSKVILDLIFSKIILMMKAIGAQKTMNYYAFRLTSDYRKDY